MFLWGRGFDNFRIHKPQLFYTFDKSIRSISFGSMHGAAVEYNGGLLTWGDGTYGELGIPDDDDDEKTALIVPKP